MGILLALLIFSSLPVDYVEVQGVIGPVAAEFITKSISLAERESQLLVIALDTPGGLDESMRIIVKRIMSAEIPVCVYVYPPGARAASAGVFITMAAHIAAMAPGTNIGAAHPVTMGQQVDSTMMEKITNDAVAYLKSIAKKRGRNEEWAEKAVRESESATSREALELNVIDVVAKNLKELLEKIDGRKIQLEDREVKLETSDAQIREIKMGLRERILAIISNPNVAYILLILGFYGLFFELSHPGSILPGVIGVISLILAFYAFQTLPVNYAGVLLILLAMILYIAEIKIQSHGLLGIGGTIALLLGSIMLFETGVPFLRISWSTIGVVVVVSLIFFFFVIAKGIQALRRRPRTGIEGLIGEEGVATRDFEKGEGTVMVHGEIWRASSDEPIKEGMEIEVIEARGLKLKVRPKKSESQS
jgi:membrane-bound serine protease (ClpP class)